MGQQKDVKLHHRGLIARARDFGGDSIFFEIPNAR